ncbi:MAG: hypothetical protein HFI83_03155 [Eubacterium sp.]|nr:hypothetical protein [Eubacterium sp.]
MKKKRLTYLMLAAAVLLLLGSTVGSTRAALTYYSDNYVAKITVSQIGVSLLENGEVVSSRDYNDNAWKVTTNKGDGSASGSLLANLLKPEEKLALNKKYDEKLTVKNSGSIDEYVRVRIYRYWMKDGQKVTTLSPDLIDLNLINSGQWVKNSNETAECVELFYKGILKTGKETEPFADTVRIDGRLAQEATIETKGDTVTTVYKYDGVEFHIDVEVDAVQTHNAKDAIKSAWGVDASGLGIL